MLKAKVAKRKIISNFVNVISVDECALQILLHCKEPAYYTAGVYGWNADIYVIGYETVIVTGCRPFGSLDGHINSLAATYEAKAKELCNGRGVQAVTVNQLINGLDSLLAQYVESVINSNKGIKQ